MESKSSKLINELLDHLDDLLPEGFNSSFNLDEGRLSMVLSSEVSGTKVVKTIPAEYMTNFELCKKMFEAWLRIQLLGNQK